MTRKRTKSWPVWLAGLLMAALLMASPAARAGQLDLETRIQTLEQSLQELKAQLAEMKKGQQEIKSEQKQVKQAAPLKLPSWLDRFTFYGDTRFRYEMTSYDDFQGKSKDSRSRLRVRLRFGVKSRIHPDVELGLRLATGSDDDPTSTNQTMGNYWGEYHSLGIDRAYLTWTPWFLPQRNLALGLGKFANPLVTSKAMWDGDVQPEGGWFKYTFNKEGRVRPFVLGTVWYLKEHKSDPPSDLVGWTGQVGVKAKLGRFKLLAATSYYDWGELGEAGQLPPNIHGNPTYTEGGGDRMSSFRVWDLYLKGSYQLARKSSLGMWGHYLANTDASGPYDDRDKGWAAGIKYSYHQFSLGTWYKYVEANATPAFIADSDSGYVNRKGWVVGLGYQFWKYGKIKLTYFNMQAIDGDLPGASNDYQTFFTDLIFKF